jgi:protein-disulfide isomerase
VRLLLAGFVALTLMWTPLRSLHAQANAAEVLAPRTKGSAKAPVTVYEMSDFQCPYCQRFAVETFPAIEREYIATGKVRWIFVNYPLTSLHANAVAAAQVATCAGKQGAFWAMHDLLYKHQEAWAPLKEAAPVFLSLADSIKISKPVLLECVNAPQTMDEIRSEAQGAERSGAQSTPSFYIEGGLVAGAHAIPVFRQVLDSVYKQKTGK